MEGETHLPLQTSPISGSKGLVVAVNGYLTCILPDGIPCRTANSRLSCPLVGTRRPVDSPPCGSNVSPYYLFKTKKGTPGPPKCSLEDPVRRSDGRFQTDNLLRIAYEPDSESSGGTIFGNLLSGVTIRNSSIQRIVPRPITPSPSELSAGRRAARQKGS